MDTADFTELLRRHAGLIHKIAYAYCRNATDREDVVQEIVAQLWRSRVRYDERYRHTTWIYRIALNVAISFYRRERKHVDRAQPLDEQRFIVEPVEPSEDAQSCSNRRGARHLGVERRHQARADQGHAARITRRARTERTRVMNLDDLDDLKRVWAEHGAVLERSLAINERLLRETMLRKVRFA